MARVKNFYKKEMIATRIRFNKREFSSISDLFRPYPILALGTQMDMNYITIRSRLDNPGRLTADDIKKICLLFKIDPRKFLKAVLLELDRSHSALKKSTAAR